MFKSNVYLVTGGAGFVGSHLIDRLLGLNVGRVILLDNFNDYYAPILKQRNIEYLHQRYPTCVWDGNLIVIRGDINDRELLKMIFDKYQITHIAHLAALAGVRSSLNQTGKYLETNYLGTQILLDVSVSYKIQQFVFASTSSVYGQTDQLPFIETDPCAQPLSPYAATKRAAEILAYVYYNMHGLNVTILRLFNVYGPRGRPDMMPMKLMRACLDSSYIIDVFDHGEMKRDWTYIDDVIDGFIHALEQPFGYEIINIGCGNPIKLSTLIQQIEHLSNRDISQRLMSSEKSEPSITFCDNSKARKLLNFISKTNIRDGLEKTWHWFQEEYSHEEKKTISIE